MQMNREPLWPSNYANTTTLQLVTKLNTVNALPCSLSGATDLRYLSCATS